MKRAVFTALAILILAASSAEAHYLWITIDSKGGGPATVNLVFEGGLGPGDGKYLDPFIERGTTWVRTAKDTKPRVLKMNETKKEKLRWLTAKLDVAAPRVLESYGRYGVYRYGKTDVQLHYYTKHLDLQSPGDLATLGKSEKLELDVAPRQVDEEIELQVLFRGKPAAGRSIIVRGAGKFGLKTDENGKARFKPEKRGLYTVRTSVEEKKSGKDPADEKPYTLIRHNATLTMKLPLNTAASE